MAAHDDLLTFWFGELVSPWSADGAHQTAWFQGGVAFDEALRGRFGDALSAAEAGALDGWAETPRGRLALIILLDQLSRNLYRGSDKAFRNDARALALATELVDSGDDRALAPQERLFAYLPFEHSEALADQDRAVALFAAMQAEAPPDAAEQYANYTLYAQRHRDVVARFGRFPHRNERLGRETTDAERAFLATPGSSFG